MQRRIMSSLQIMELYKKGERDFSYVTCSNVNFSKANLSGCNFSNSVLSFNYYEDANLSGCDFSNANLEWSSFRRADLQKSNFTKANLSYSVLNNAKVDGATFNNADVSWCFIFDVEMEKVAEKKNANFHMTAFNPGQVSKQAREQARKHLESMKGILPSQLFIELDLIMKSDDESIRKINITEQSKTSGYQTNVGFGYGGNESNSGYTISNAAAGYTTLAVGQSYGVTAHVGTSYSPKPLNQTNDVKK